MDDIIMKIEGLKVYYKAHSGIFKKDEYVKAVDGVDLDIIRGEVFGIVGESGCGKSTLGRAIINLTEKYSGKIILDGIDISKFNDRKMRPIRKIIQMIFQDPYASLNPRMSIRKILAEPLKVHNLVNGNDEIEENVIELLEKVGLDSYYASRYPHEFSGGQRQRIGIARALAVKPKVIIADEPVSALDVSIQAQVLNLMKDLKKEFNLTYIFIAHDLSVVKHISDRVGVMYLGNFVEVADKESIYEKPLHPYTEALLSSVPIPNPRVKKEKIILEGNIPSALNPPKGCKFHTRCPKCMDICKEVEPKKYEATESHYVYCHLYD